MQFQHGNSYPIETLPDDLHDKTITNRDRWAIRDALFWNDCQGWWIGRISTERQQLDFGQSTARFWQPLPIDPMTREQILAERGMTVCPKCGRAAPDYCICEQVPYVALDRDETYIAPDSDAA